MSDNTLPPPTIPKGYRKYPVIVGSEKPLDAVKSHMGWQTAWLTAVAYAWSDVKLKRALMNDPNDFFKRYCDYKVPPNLDVKVKEAKWDNVDKNGKEDESSNPLGWENGDNSTDDDVLGLMQKGWYLKNNELTMYLPPKPGKLEHEAVALANYLEIGRTYPFTSG